MGNPIRVLCLDIEGGYGGSSRSLFQSIFHMDRSLAHCEVWCKKPGPIQKGYADIGVPCKITPEMPKESSRPRLRTNAKLYTKLLRDFVVAGKFRKALLERLKADVDLIHFNHEGLFILGSWLHGKHPASAAMHMRTLLPNNVFSRFQCRTISKTMDQLVCITENELENMAMLSGTRMGRVIYNIAEAPQASSSPEPSNSKDGTLRVATLANYSWHRATDRLVDVAVELAKRERRDIHFVVAGKMDLPRYVVSQLGGFRGNTMRDYAQSRGVSEQFTFLGHVPNPKVVLESCDVLVRPSRAGDPWGRDVLEALANGKPVVATGQYDRFVETGVTGFLHRDFVTDNFCRDLVELADNPGMRQRMAANAAKRARDLCGGKERSADLLRVWRKAVLERSK